ncbi:MAG: hypothetical protein WA045_03080, partial [Nitrospira sp.]
FGKDLASTMSSVLLVMASSPQTTGPWDGTGRGVERSQPVRQPRDHPEPEVLITCSVHLRK